MLIAPAGAIAPTAGPIDEETTTPAAETSSEHGCKTHPPIKIVGDEGPTGFVLGHDENGEPIYRPGSGVVDGNGTAEDPYVIADWCITPVGHHNLRSPQVESGIFLLDTTAHVVIRDNLIRGEPPSLGTGDGPSAPFSKYEYGISLSENANVSVISNDIRGLGAGLFIGNADDVTISENAITDHSGDGIQIYESGSVEIHENNLQDNPTALDFFDSTESVDARNNWWGSASGPSGGVEDACTGTKADGDGAKIETDSGQVEICFDPWRSSPVPDAGLGSASSSSRTYEGPVAASSDAHDESSPVSPEPLIDYVRGDCPEHPPIQITEDEGPRGFVLGENPATGEPIYRPGSGVVDGTGTAEDPYVISDWCIALDDHKNRFTSSFVDGISISGTNSHVEIRNVIVNGDEEKDHTTHSTGISIRASNVTVRDTQVSDYHEGIEVEEAQNVQLVDNTVVDNGYGIRMVHARDVELLDNQLVENLNNAWIEGSEGTMFESNLVASGPAAFYYSNNALVEDNTFDDGSLSLSISDDATVGDNVFEDGGISMAHGSDHTIADSNTVNGDPVRVIEDQTDVTVPAPAGQVILLGTTSVRVAGLNLSDTVVGVQAFHAKDTEVEHNRLSGNVYGVRLEETTESEIVQNQFSDHYAAVKAVETNETVVQANNFDPDGQGLDGYALESPIDARNNWWGDAAGPGGGDADACTGTIADGSGANISLDEPGSCFEPWRSSPVSNAGLRG